MLCVHVYCFLVCIYLNVCVFVTVFTVTILVMKEQELLRSIVPVCRHYSELQYSCQCNVATYCCIVAVCVHIHCFLISLCMYICYSLSSNNISDEGARAVADGMKYCTSQQSQSL